MAMSIAEELVRFLNFAKTPFHAVAKCKEILAAAGFVELQERDAWKVCTLLPHTAYPSKLSSGGRYYYSRNQSTLVAFAIGKQFKAGGPFAIVGGL